MAHRQKNRDGTPIRHELTAANDCDTAHREVLRRMETYGKDPDAALEEVSRDTVLLLRALNHRVRHFQAQILADIKIRESYHRTPRTQPRNVNPTRIRDRHYTNTSYPVRESSFRQVQRTDANEKSNPPATHDANGKSNPPVTQQPAKDEETQPATDQPTLNNTIANEHHSPDADRDHPCPTDQIHQKTRPTPEIDAQVTNFADESDVDTGTEIAVMGRRRPQASEYMTPTSDNEDRNVAITPKRKIYGRDPNEPKPQYAAAKTSKQPRSSPGGKHTTTNDSVAKRREYPPLNEQTGLPTEEKRHEIHPLRRPRDRNTLDSETKLDIRNTHYQGNTIVRPYAIMNQGEPHTNRNVNLIPDRGKEPNEATTTGIENEEPPPQPNDSCTYKL